MGNFVNRGDKLYTGIQRIENYEITSCIRREIDYRANYSQKKAVSLRKAYVNSRKKQIKNGLVCHKHIDKDEQFSEKECLHSINECNITVEAIEYREATRYKKFLITPNFKRDKISTNILPDIWIELDLTLPEHELIAYIKAIKKRFDSYAIFDDKLFSDMNLSEYDFEHQQIPGLTQYRWADRLFIYDAIEAGMTQKNIKWLIDQYYINKPKFKYKKSANGIDLKTIREHYKSVKNIVEEFKLL